MATVYVAVLTLTYVLERERDVKAFADFTRTELVQPLIKDAAACSDCANSGTTGRLSEL